MSIKSDRQGFDISSFSAAVIGCGGLGTNVAVHLAGAGIGKLLLWDFDEVEIKNLNRQYMYTAEDEGKAKSLVLKNKLKAFAPDCEIESVCVKIEDISQLFSASDFDIVILAVDNVECRVIVDKFCTKENIPLINGSLYDFCGTAYLSVPGKTANLSEAGVLDKINYVDLAPSTTAGVIGALEAKLAIDYFLKKEQSWGKIYDFDGDRVRVLDPLKE